MIRYIIGIGGDMKKILLGFMILSSLFLLTGCKKSIVGKWKAIDTNSDYYYIFHNNKTCSYEMNVARLDCTYEISGDTIRILYKGSDKKTTFQYHFEGKVLIITDENGKDNKFIKV